MDNCEKQFINIYNLLPLFLKLDNFSVNLSKKFKKAEI